MRPRMRVGRESPCTTSVARITAKVRKRIRSRPGNGVPPSTVRGSERAAASEITPRIPVQDMTVTARGDGKGSGQRKERLSHRGKYVAEKTQRKRTSMTVRLMRTAYSTS